MSERSESIHAVRGLLIGLVLGVAIWFGIAYAVLAAIKAMDL